MRRSERHASDIAQLLSSSPAHTPSDTYRSPPDTYRAPFDSPHASVPTPGGSRGAAYTSPSTAGSPSVTAQQWRARRTATPPSEHRRSLSRERARTPQDTAAERQRASARANVPWARSGTDHALEPAPRSPYAHLRPSPRAPVDDADTIHRLSRLSISSEHRRTPRSGSYTSLPRSVSHASVAPRDAASATPHTDNLHRALDQFAQQCHDAHTCSPALYEQLGASAELADTVNTGLRRALRDLLELRMAWALQPTHDALSAMVDPLDASLSVLLKHSDDHVRSITDTLLLLAQQERQHRRATPRVPRRHVSLQHRSPPTSPVSHTGRSVATPLLRELRTARGSRPAPPFP